MSGAPPLPTFTKEWHSKPYDSISLDRPELSAKGRTVIVTGGGTGIGAATALAFAKAGASIGLIGRRESKLQSSAAEITSAVPNAVVKYAVADVANEAETQAAFKSLHESLGPLEIFVHSAGFYSSTTHIASPELDNGWWKVFEINVRGTYNAARAFVAHSSTEATLINVSSGIAHLPSIPGLSSYAASKIASSKIIENLGVENSNLHVVNIQPGIVMSEMVQKAGGVGYDEPELPAYFSVWLTSPEAKFLNGKFVWANWDVEELKARAEEIKNSRLLTLTLDGPVFG